MTATGVRHERALVWFRRDLRDFDHAALHAALRDARTVYCAFVFDREILDALPRPDDRRVEFIHDAVVELDRALAARGGALIVRHGRARDAIGGLAAELAVDAVYANHDYEPAARDRDAAVAQDLADRGIAFETRKDHVIFERDEVLSQSGKPFSVFTPYRNAWLRTLTPYHLKSYPVARHDRRARASAGRGRRRDPGARDDGLRAHQPARGGRRAGHGGRRRARGGLSHADRRVPRRPRLPRRQGSFVPVGAPALRHGVDPRACRIRARAFARARTAKAPRRGCPSSSGGTSTRRSSGTTRTSSARASSPSTRTSRSRTIEAKFAAWCSGATGYPLVDAAMRQLNTTGYMHNRLRMVAASFLVKDLLVDWRWGERYFADTLIDFDLASNNGGWQWAASTGCDAQPYFRIFNPVAQSERFDAGGKFIRRYVPEVAALDAAEIHAPWRVPPAIQQAKGVVVGRDYPAPIVDHAAARLAALALFKRT